MELGREAERRHFLFAVVRGGSFERTRHSFYCFFVSQQQQRQRWGLGFVLVSSKKKICVNTFK